jgi:hypothetical protein
MIKIGKYKFDGPWPLREVDFLDRACVYVILCKKLDGKYRIIYAGETGQVGTRLSNHEKYACWDRNCYSELHVAIFLTPSEEYTPEDRREIEKEIRDQYDPACNRQ